MPSGEFDLLGHIGVSVPTVTVQPAAAAGMSSVARQRSSADTHTRIFAPREKPPPPTRAQHSSVQRAARKPPTSTNNSNSSATATAACYPTDEVRIEEKDGKMIEHQIWNSNIPCNWAYNAQLAKNRAEKRESERLSQQHVDPNGNDSAFTFEEKSTGKSAEDRLAERDAQNRDLEQRRLIKQQQREAAQAAERAEVSRMAAEAKEQEKAELLKKREEQRHFAESQSRLLQEARAAKQRQREAERGSKSENQGLGIGAELRSQEQQQQHAKETMAQLNSAWRVQMEEKKKRSQEEKARNEALFAKTMDSARADERLELQRREKERQLAETAMKNFQSRKEQEAIRKHDQAAAERRAAMEEERVRQSQQAAEQSRLREQRAAFKDAIKQQLKDKQTHRQQQQQQDRAIDKGNRELSVGMNADVLLRCPVTKRLLPPSHYNIPLSQQPRPVLHRSAPLK